MNGYLIHSFPDFILITFRVVVYTHLNADVNMEPVNKITSVQMNNYVTVCN
jgi:hypothetical protein